MFAIDHAATALLIKRKYPSVSIVPLLVGTQAMELAWVLFNYLGLEHTTTDPVVTSVANIHLSDIIYSHSVVTAIVAALTTWLVLELGFHRPALGRAMGIAIASHLVLDLLTHARDIAVWPRHDAPKLGLGLYANAPMTAFALEMAYGVLCWRVYRGGTGLLVVIVAANLANLSVFSGSIAGPEVFLAGRPTLIVTVILGQIVVTAALVAMFSRRPEPLWLRERSTSRQGGRS